MCSIVPSVRTRARCSSSSRVQNKGQVPAHRHDYASGAAPGISASAAIE